MQSIVAPIKFKDAGPQVANLIECLLFLVERGVLKTVAPPNKPTKKELGTLAAGAQRELATQTFGKASLRLVLYLQVQQGLGDTAKGAVDDTTAQTLNALLLATGAVFDVFDESDLWIVEGVVRQGDVPVEGALVSVFHRGLRVREPLGAEATADANGHYLVSFRAEDFQRGDTKQSPTPWLIVEARANATAPVIAVEKRDGVERRMSIDVQLDGRLSSESERSIAAVLPLLTGRGPAGANLSLLDLTAADAEFIVLSTGLDRAAVEALIASSTMQKDALQRLGDNHAKERTVVEASAWPFFYGVARSRLASTLDEVLHLGPQQWNQSRRMAEAANRIPAFNDVAWTGVAAALALLADIRRLDVKQGPWDHFTNVLAGTSSVLSHSVALDALGLFRQKGLDATAFEEMAGAHPREAKAIRGFARAARLHTLTDGELSVMKALDAKIDEDTASIAPLVQLSADDWIDLVKQASPQVNAAGSEARAYALQAKVEVEHPLPALVGRVKQGSLGFRNPEMKDFEKHVDKHPKAIAALLGGKTDAAGVDALPKAVQKAVRNLGRFSRTGLTYEVGATLIDNGFDSPASAHGAGEDILKSALRNLPPKVIEGFIDATEGTLAGATGLISDLIGESLHRPPHTRGGATAIPQEVRENLPTLRGFFGDLDECMCRPCESVLGQPAYLVDLLNLLKQVRVGEGTNSALDLLRDRRPDIYDLELTCENAENELPHIDLVLEVLENAVGLHSHSFTVSRVPNTESLLEPVDQSIRTALERTTPVVGANLTAQRAPRISGDDTAYSNWYVDDGIRRWTLRVRADRREIQIIGLSFRRSSRTTGLASAPENRNLLAYERLAQQTYPWTLPFDLPRAETIAFLNRLKVSRSELIRLQAAPAPDHQTAAALNIGAAQLGASGASPSEWQLLTTARSGAPLWNAWGLPLDGNGKVTTNDPASGRTVTEPPISALSRVSVLLDRASIDLDDLDLLVAARFVTASGIPLIIAGRDQCKTSEMRIEGITEAHLDRIHRFVRLLEKLPDWNISSLDAAIATYGAGDITAATLGQIAGLQRVASRLRIPVATVASSSPLRIETIGRALGCTSQEAGLIAALIGADSFDGVSRVERIETLCDAVDLVRGSGLSVEQTAYALLPLDTLQARGLRPPSTRAIDAVVEAQLRDLQAALRTAGTDPAFTPEPDLAQALSRWMTPTQARYIVDSIERSVFGLGRGAAPDASGITVLYQLPAGTQRRLAAPTPLFSGVEAEALLTVVSGQPRTAQEVQERKRELQRRHGVVRDRIAQRLPARLREQCLLDMVASLTGWSLSLVSDVLTSYLRIDDGAQGAPASDVLLSPSFWDGALPPPVDIANAERLHDWMHRLERMVVLASTLEVPASLWQLLSTVSIDGATGIDWRGLLAPTRTPSGAAWQARWREWRAFVGLVQLSSDDELSVPTLQALFSRAGTGVGAVAAQTLEPLAIRLAVSNDEALSMAQRAIGTPATSAGLRDPLALKRLLTLARALRTMHAAVAQYAALIDVSNNATAALTARSLLQSNARADAWPATLAAVSDTVRVQQRDALVAHLVHRDGLTNANDLFERYLIDPQMAPCMLTTRIGQAVASAQLLVQRVLFGSEPGVSVPSDRSRGSRVRRDWPWMRNYRVWEANRKVFLYPENWLFAELRDDKSSSFTQLETALGQGELTQELAREAFGQFLDSVAQVGQIHVLGMFEDVKESARHLFVVGRSANPPYIYYWRTCIDFGTRVMEWAPWQRIELEIASDHVVPFVMNDELHIAWARIQRLEGSDNGPDKWEVGLELAKHSHSGWTSLGTSRDRKKVDVTPFSTERSGFAMRLEVPARDQDPILAVYCQIPAVASDVVSVETAPAPRPMPWTLGAEYAFGPGSPAKLAELIRTDPQYLPDDYKGLLRTWATKQKRLAEAPLDPFYSGLKVFFHDQTYFNFRATTRHDEHIGTIAGVPASYIPSYTDQIASLDGFLNDFYRSTLQAVTQNGTRPWADFVDALRRASARLSLSCRVWIKLKYEDNTDGFRELSGPASKFVARWSNASVQFNPGTPFEMVKLGPIDARSMEMSYVEDFNANKIFVQSLPTTSVAQGESTAQTLHFVLDTTRFFALELGFDIDEQITFDNQMFFRIDADDTITPESGEGRALDSWVDNSRPWMNGYQERFKNSNAPVRIRTGAGTDVEALPARPQQFWIVGAARHDWTNAGPRVWYVREGATSTFLDLGFTSGLPDSGLRAIPNSYQSAKQRKRRWTADREHWTAAENQADAFGALDLGPGSQLDSIEYGALTSGSFAFDARMPYACYNWEVFFHAPLLIADRLSKQHRFEDAEQWLRYIFDPTSNEPGDNATRFLKFRVFRELDSQSTVLQALTTLAQVAAGRGTPDSDAAIGHLIERWRSSPFRPFLIARRRHMAFLWKTLFAYLDNLIAWADSLYRRDTRESINEAIQLYVLAARILGPRPKETKGESRRPAETYGHLSGRWDDFANAWLDVAPPTSGGGRMMVSHVDAEVSPAGMLLFCVPFNDKLFTYWNTVDERLFNIRHCRSIDGLTRDLPQTDAPIDPELLVRATAAGLNLGDVIAGLYAPPPHYRFGILSARAAELASEARAMGAAVLSAIEKQDAEALAVLRSSNEIALLSLVRSVRRLQLDEAQRNLDALRANRRSVAARAVQYQRLLGKIEIAAPGEGETAGEESLLGTAAAGLASERSRLGLIGQEDHQYIGLREAHAWSTAASISKAVSGAFHASASLASAASAAAPKETGYNVLTGLAHAASATGDVFGAVAQDWKTYAESQGMLASHLRRRDEWAFQCNQAIKELAQIDKQILANQIRIDIAAKERDNHIQQIEQAAAVDDVLHTKFSNEQLYQWMVSQLSALHFSAYRMALDMARAAERAAARELGTAPLHIVRNDHWDSQRSGLLAGERLHQDIKRLDSAFLDQNRREYELTKHISLRRLDPMALLQLRHLDEDGEHRCEFEIPEWLFDMDTPGHYMRRIKSVSVTIPCVVGPYSSVSGRLTLLRSSVRHSRDARPQYRRSARGDDARFTDYFSAAESVVTSSANADSGLFDTQLRDERFLPFEGQGVESRWRFELPASYPQFDYSTIADVVLTIRYTAREAGDEVRRIATGAVAQFGEPSPATPRTLPVLLMARVDFPGAWASPGPMVLTIGRECLPYWMDATRFEVRDVRYADLVRGQSELPEFSDPNAATRAGDVWTLPAKGRDAVDRVVLLGVGVA